MGIGSTGLISTGFPIGFANAVSNGFSTEGFGLSTNFGSGFIEGFSSGLLIGDSTTLSKGLTEGFITGFSTGVSIGWSEGFPQGFSTTSTGLSLMTTKGISEGFTTGLSSILSFFTSTGLSFGNSTLFTIFIFLGRTGAADDGAATGNKRGLGLSSRTRPLLMLYSFHCSFKKPINSASLSSLYD
ncbi:MAG: hypothetical protein WC799_01305 [Desulfobacteraceae bacterium]